MAFPVHHWWKDAKTFDAMCGPLMFYGPEWMIQVLVMYLNANPEHRNCQGLPARSRLAGENIPVTLRQALMPQFIDKS